MATEQFTKLINIQVDSQSIDELDSSLKDINSEINNIKNSEIKLNQSLEEQSKALKDLNALDAKRNEILDQKNKLIEVSLTNTEKLALAEKEADKKAKEAYEDQKQREEDLKKADKKAKEAYEDQKQREEDLKKADELKIRRADDFKKAAEGIAGGFQIAAGASILFGDKTGEELAKAQAKVVGLVSAVDGAKKVVEGTISSYRLLNEAIQKSTLLSKIFGNTTKTAIASTGIGLLVVALGLVYAYFDDIIKFGNELKDSLGLGDVVKEFDAFSESIGGISGYFKILGGLIKGYVKEVVNYYQILFDIFTYDFDGVVKNVKEVGTAIVDETVKAVEKAEKDAAAAREIKRKEGLIRAKQLEIDILKAQGKETLALEKETTDLRVDLINYKLSKAEKGSEDELKIQEDLNKELVNLEANKKAQADKLFDSQLKGIQTQYNKRLKVITDNLTNESITEEEFNVKRFQLELDLINKEISLRKKRNEDTSALEVQKSELILSEKQRLSDNEKALDEKSNQDALDQIEKSYLERQILQQELFSQGLISEKEYNDNLLNLEKDHQEELLNLQKEGSIEYLNIQKELNDKEIEQQKELNDKKVAEEQYYLQQEAAAAQSIINNNKNTYKERVKAADDFRDSRSQDLDLQLQKAKDVYGEDSLEYKKLIDQKTALDEQYNQTVNKLSQERIQSTLNIANQALQTLTSINDAINAIQQNQIDESNNRIEELTSKNEELKSQIEETNQNIEDSTNKINELEQSLSDAQGSRSEVTKQRLEEERARKASLVKEDKKNADAIIANEKKIQAERDKIEKLERERRNREKAIAITQAVISTASGVVGALGTPPFGVPAIILASLIGAAGAAQIATIAAQKFEDGGYLEGPSHAEGGIKGSGRFSNIEVEGGEFIVNKKSTQKYLPLLYAINEGNVRTNNDKFAEGGTIPSFDTINSIQQTSNQVITQISNQPVYVAVTEINEVGKKVTVIENSGTF